MDVDCGVDGIEQYKSWHITSFNNGKAVDNFLG